MLCGHCLDIENQFYTLTRHPLVWTGFCMWQLSSILVAVVQVFGSPMLSSR